MERVPEPELMDQGPQARAYAQADFDEPHGRFVALLADRLGELPARGAALDLGCGPGDITYRFARAWPGWTIEGLDGARAMLELAEHDPRHTALWGRVRFRHARLPDEGPSRTDYDLVLSNSLLHHLADPLDLWRAVLCHAAPGARVFVMDLLRPESPAAAREMVARYAADEAEVLQHDFHRSLLAAYRPEEVRAQLASVRLPGLTLEVVSDRHWIVHGAAPPSAGRRDAAARCARRREVG